MALVKTACVRDTALAGLKTQTQTLDAHLTMIQYDYELLRTDHDQKCALSMNEALAGLLSLVDHVSRTDRALLYWVEKGKSVKTLLRCVGMDKRTDTIVEKKSAKMKKKVNKVEGQFRDAGKAVMDELRVVQDINTRMADYSISRVGGIQNQARGMQEVFSSEVSVIQRRLDEKQLQCDSTEVHIREITGEIEMMEKNRETAKESSKMHTLVILPLLCPLCSTNRFTACCRWLAGRRAPRRS